MIDPIERALWRAGVATLETFLEAAEKIGLPYYLFEGTLLGCVRDHDFCPGDADDIDIAVLDEDWGQVMGITEGSWFRVLDRFIYRENVEGVKVQLTDNLCRLDICRLRKHPSRDERFNVGRLNIDGKQVYCANVYASEDILIPEDVFADARMFGLDVRIPRESELLLAHRYGPAWQTPVHRDNWDWTKRVPNDCVRFDYDGLTL